ncbi:MAG: bifunctional oligoribonuclease/PAP phosphatase NrnA [Clostridiales bacterium]|nr:bifunctional oligoribonuclease/PAP phosphatase NrnA [Clostridiales bacterium]
MKISVKQCAELLSKHSDIIILTHAHPDGDTLGCGFALFRALKKLGKRAVVLNDDIPEKYEYLYKDLSFDSIESGFVVAVDVATPNLLGELEGKYHINMCIDHHATNTHYADYLLLEETAAACETIYKVIKELGVQIDKDIAGALYTGISTDTGCFRYASTTPQTLRTAAELLELGAPGAFINRLMFETKTKTYARLEKMAIDSMKFYCGERVAIITVTQEMYKLSGSGEQETEPLAPLTRQIEGVEIGISLREKPCGGCKASIRTFESVNAAQLAAAFGGGGHPQAAACRFDCGVKQAAELLVAKCEELLK